VSAPEDRLVEAEPQEEESASGLLPHDVMQTPLHVAYSVEPHGKHPAPELPASDFMQVPLQVSYSTGEQPLTGFYVPLLARAKEYKRLVGYFSARVLARAAAGFAPFVARRAKMQLVVGAQLSDEDVDAVLHGQPLDEIVAQRLCLEPLTEGVGIVQQEHLRLFAWMLREGLLELRVGVPVDAHGTPLRPEQARRYFHSKYGLFTDELGRQVAFSGSDNETVAGWTGNHETFHVYWSWNETVWALYGEDVTRRLEQHWDGTPDAGWEVMPVPDALRQRLISVVPAGWTPPVNDPDPRLREIDVPDDPLGGGPALGWKPTPAEDLDAHNKATEADRDRLLELLRAPLSRTMVGVASAAAVPLPHQQLIAVRAVETFPRGYLLADEVGLGKTIEAGLILRELLLSGRSTRHCCWLRPASCRSGRRSSTRRSASTSPDMRAACSSIGTTGRYRTTRRRTRGPRSLSCLLLRIWRGARIGAASSWPASGTSSLWTRRTMHAGEG
jgi:hypothetical protein